MGARIYRECVRGRYLWRRRHADGNGCPGFSDACSIIAHRRALSGGQTVVEKPSPRGRKATAWRAKIGEVSAFLRARVKIYSANMRLVFRPSKPHPSSSDLTIRSARPCTTDASKKPPARSVLRRQRRISRFSGARARLCRLWLLYFAMARENSEKNRSQKSVRSIHLYV